jgi:hypothetical protein
MASAVAHGGSSGRSAGVATATTKATGASGTFGASADTSLLPGKLVQAVAASASGTVGGESTAKARAAIAGAPAKISSLEQAVAFITGAPTTASAAVVLAANSVIKAMFGTKPSFFAIGALGGSFSVGGGGSQTTTSEVDETIDLTQLASRRDLVVGFYGGSTLGSGVTGVTFDLYADGNDVLSKTFATASDAQSWFTDKAVDLGSLASGQPLGANTLTLRAVVTVTTDSAGSGFSGDIILGDPKPQAVSAPSAGQFIQATAAFGPDPASSMVIRRPFGGYGRPPLIAIPHIAAVS